MNDLTISIFGNKILLEIINEIKLFSKFNIKYYEDLNLCISDAEEQNLLTIFFIDKELFAYSICLYAVLVGKCSRFLTMLIQISVYRKITYVQSRFILRKMQIEKTIFF